MGVPEYGLRKALPALYPLNLIRFEPAEGMGRSRLIPPLRGWILFTG